MLICLRERGKGERERYINVRNIDWLPPIHAPTGDQTHNLDMYTDQELNLHTFGIWDNAPSN